MYETTINVLGVKPTEKLSILKVLKKEEEIVAKYNAINDCIKIYESNDALSEEYKLKQILPRKAELALISTQIDYLRDILKLMLGI